MEKKGVAKSLKKKKKKRISHQYDRIRGKAQNIANISNDIFSAG